MEDGILQSITCITITAVAIMACLAFLISSLAQSIQRKDFQLNTYRLGREKRRGNQREKTK
jgi:hypothetical protein